MRDAALALVAITLVLPAPSLAGPSPVVTPTGIVACDPQSCADSQNAGYQTAGYADSAQTPGAGAVAPCDASGCVMGESAGGTGVQVLRKGQGNSEVEQSLPDADNQLADVFLLVLLASLVLIVPITATRPRSAAGDGSRTTQPAMWLAWSRGRRRSPGQEPNQTNGSATRP